MLFIWFAPKQAGASPTLLRRLIRQAAPKRKRNGKERNSKVTERRECNSLSRDGSFHAKTQRPSQRREECCGSTENESASQPQKLKKNDREIGFGQAPVNVSASLRGSLRLCVKPF